LQRPPNHLFDNVPILKNLVIPESQHPKPLPCKPGGALCVVYPTLRVLTAVEFQDQALVKTDKVRDERAEGDLTAKLVGGETAVSQSTPDESLRVTLGLSKLAGSIAVHR